MTSFDWKPCGDLPVRSGRSRGTTTIINGEVYYGGRTGYFEQAQDEHIVCCYDPSRDEWTTLPPLPIKDFGLGQINGKLVAVGGRKDDYEAISEVYTYDDHAKKWKQTIPPMPTARHSPGVLSLQSALVVAGGVCEHTCTIPSSGFVNAVRSKLMGTSTRERTEIQVTEINAVDVFKPDTLQWYKTTPLPRSCHYPSVVAIGDTCYALGGYRYHSYLNQALHASVDDLLRNAVPANQTTHSGSSDTQSAWKTLPNTPIYGPVAAVLAGNLLAVGSERSGDFAYYDDSDSDDIDHSTEQKIYIHVPSTNSWAYIGVLPFQRSCITVGSVAVLSPLKILVVAGTTAFKGTPMLFK